MRDEDEVDVVVRQAAARATAGWSPARAEAALTSLGLVPGQRPASLAQAASIAGVSRESVRRDRGRILHALQTDEKVAAAAQCLEPFVRTHESISAQAVAARGVEDGILADVDAFVPTWNVLSGARLVDAPTGSHPDAPVTLDDPADSEAARLLDRLDDGLPHDLATAVGPDGGDRILDMVRRHLSVWSTRWAGHLWVGRADAADTPAGRALRRLLTMTGPLPWADLRAAWARAKGRPPYGPLPADLPVLVAWAKDVAGVQVRTTPAGMQLLEAAGPPVDLTQVDQLLYDRLSAAPAGMPRADLLEAAERAGLAASSVSGVLAHHPALVNVSRGLWALRVSPERALAPAAVSPAALRRPRARPTTYTWASSGRLELEMSVPAGPSPVVAVPAAVAGIVQDLTLPVLDPPGAGTVSVRNARAWGFAAAFAALDVRAGQRVTLSIDLVARTATISLTERR